MTTKELTEWVLSNEISKKTGIDREVVLTYIKSRKGGISMDEYFQMCEMIGVDAIDFAVEVAKRLELLHLYSKLSPKRQKEFEDYLLQLAEAK